MYNFDQEINRYHTNSIKYDQADENVIPMWVADMDFETLPEVKEALIKRASHGIFGYASVEDDYYESVISWMKRRHDLDIQKDWITTTCGVVSAIKLAIRAYTKENDAILIMKPVYYPFDISIQTNHRKKIEFPLDLIEDHYECNTTKLEKSIKENQVKMVILCNPHNPIGKVYTKDELIQIGNICKKYHVIVVSDEIHQDFIYKGNKHIPFYLADDSFKEFSILCTAPSKTFNLAALQTSNIIIANKELRTLYLEEKQKSGINDPNIFGLEAAKAAYQYGEQWLDELIDYLQGNIDAMREYLHEYLPELKMLIPQGTYLVWLDMRALGLSHEELEKFMLNEAHLMLDEGYIFGKEGAGFERINIACTRKTLMKALNQLYLAVQKLKK